jgi:hypothetical protein
MAAKTTAMANHGFVMTPMRRVYSRDRPVQRFHATLPQWLAHVAALAVRR